MKLKVPTLTCRRCGHRWVPRQTTITICPRCKSLLWNVPPRSALEKWRWKDKQKRRLAKKKTR